LIYTTGAGSLVDMQPPTITDVLKARLLLAKHLPETPMWTYSAINERTGATVFVKHENAQPTGAFKVRGGLNLLAGLPVAERNRGIVGYSTGNHAQSLAYAAARYGVPCVIVMPANSNPLKAQAVRDLGAELVEYGADFENARAHAEDVARDRQMRLISAANEPAIIAGVGTAYFEVLLREPDIDTIVVPVGSGTGAAAAGIVAAALNPQCAVVAVQSTASPAAHDSWVAGGPVERPNRTAIAGLATGSGFALAQALLRRHLGEFLLVDDDAVVPAQRLLYRAAHTVAEGAGAAALAAVLGNPDRFAGRRIAVMCSGGNADPAELGRIAGGTPAGPDRQPQGETT
jgi:threonine dehydratase